MIDVTQRVSVSGQDPPGLSRHAPAHLDPDDYAALVGDDELDRALARILHRHRTGQLPASASGS